MMDQMHHDYDDDLMHHDCDDDQIDYRGSDVSRVINNSKLIFHWEDYGGSQIYSNCETTHKKQ